MNPAITGLAALLAAVVTESFAQMFLKIGAAGGAPVLPARVQRVVGVLPLSAFAASWIGLGVITYGVEVLLYTIALNYLDVSVAFPLGSLCFVGVALLSKIFLGETVGRIRWLGVGCILAGTIVISL